MNRRMTKTYKILAVAVTAVGCSSAAPPEARVEPPTTAAAAAPMAPTKVAAVPTTPPPPPPTTATTSATSKDTKEVTAPTTPPPPPPMGTKPDDPKLLALRAELAPLDAKEAEQKKGHFRPLCDADGYPLVGNVARKGDGRFMDPSAFCALVRTKAK
jgi:hypothetical protein